MCHTTIGCLAAILPLSIAIWLVILATILGWFLGACVFLFVTGWRIDKRHNIEIHHKPTIMSDDTHVWHAKIHSHTPTDID
jgi:hypothetical protein